MKFHGSSWQYYLQKGEQSEEDHAVRSCSMSGFIVHSISDMGRRDYMLMIVGGVKPLAQFIQKVRILTEDGKKIHGIIQATLRATPPPRSMWI